MIISPKKKILKNIFACEYRGNKRGIFPLEECNDIVVEKGNKVLSPQGNINEYKAGNFNASGFIYDLDGFVSLSR